MTLINGANNDGVSDVANVRIIVAVATFKDIGPQAEVGLYTRLHRRRRRHRRWSRATTIRHVVHVCMCVFVCGRHVNEIYTHRWPKWPNYCTAAVGQRPSVTSETVHTKAVRPRGQLQPTEMMIVLGGLHKLLQSLQQRF